MARHDLICAGPHADGAAPVLGTVDLPDGYTPRDPSLCQDCGDVYSYAVITEQHAPGRPLRADLVATLLPELRPPGWAPAHAYGRPSWAGPTDKPWPWPGPKTS